MQRLTYVLFALDEARRYIEDGRRERLRLALLLLDNAIELQMERRIQDDLAYEQMRENLRNRILEGPQHDLPESLQEVVAWIPLTKKEKIRIDRFFNEKLIYLSKRSKHLDSRLVEPISYLHGYRNEAYHKSVTRPATIRTAAILMLEINCLLMNSFPISMGCYASDEDYSWIDERFGVSPTNFFFDKNKLKFAADSIRGNLIPGREAVISSLIEHLESRFEELYGSIDFITENTRFSDRAESLHYCQYYEAIRNSEIDATALSPENYKAPYNLDSIEHARNDIESIVQASGNIDAFHRFSLVERMIEPIEQVIDSAHFEVEAMIQREIDLRRGK